jgi:hypothetical protein
LAGTFTKEIYLAGTNSTCGDMTYELVDR